VAVHTQWSSADVADLHSTHGPPIGGLFDSPTEGFSTLTSIGRIGGNLIIDHSASPGIPADLAEKWERMGIPVAREGVTLEADTWTCPHCNRVVIRNMERTRAREVCRKCMHVVCDSCVDNCRPFWQAATEAFDKGMALDPITNLMLPVARS
jgi:hypothetical protein